VKVNYLGVTDPGREFAALRPAHDRLRAMMIRCRPMGPDYLILLAAHDALGKAAQHFTKDPYVYGGSHKGQG
jgi:hypothetical protein